MIYQSSKDENARFRRLNKDLRIIISFLGSKTDDLKLSHEYLVSTLVEQMLSTWTIMIENMPNKLLEQLADWDCELSYRFRLQPFDKDAQLPINAQFYDKVITHLENRLYFLTYASTRKISNYSWSAKSLHQVKDGGYIHDLIKRGSFTACIRGSGLLLSRWKWVWWDERYQMAQCWLFEFLNIKRHNELVFDYNPGVQWSIKSINVCM